MEWNKGKLVYVTILCKNLFLQNEQKFHFLHPYANIELFLLIQCLKFTQSKNDIGFHWKKIIEHVCNHNIISQSHIFWSDYIWGTVFYCICAFPLFGLDYKILLQVLLLYSSFIPQNDNKLPNCKNVLQFLSY